MTIDEISNRREYALVDRIITEKEVALYILSDPHVRLRDSFATIQLTNFFTEKGVRVSLRAVSAKYRRLFDDMDMTRLLDPGHKLYNEAETCLNNVGKPVKERMLELFELVGRTPQGVGDKDELNHMPQTRGPVIILGRPSFFPATFMDNISTELRNRGDGKGHEGRFKIMEEDPFNDRGGFRTFIDTYSGIEISTEKFAEHRYSDSAVIRAVKGAFPNRLIIFAYGTSSLGTQAAAQTLVDRDLNMDLNRLGIGEFLDTHGYVEFLLRAEPHRHSISIPWAKEFEPSEVRVVAKPFNPVNEEFVKWMRCFRTMTFDEEFKEMYRLDSTQDDASVFECIHPKEPGLDESKESCAAWQMIGGRKIQEISEELRALGRSAEQMAIMLVGPTGVGKELAARIIYQERVRGLLRSLSEGSDLDRPIVVGPRYVALNCAGFAEKLAESQLFGIRDKFAHETEGQIGAILGAGEGVVLLDEIQSMPLEMQAKLLRAAQPPYRVAPIGINDSLPSSASIIAATNEEPDLLVSKGRLREDLYARFRSHVVRIPRLAERPGDIPALLAHIAAMPVQFNENVMQCLLAYHHPHNIRGLYQIIGHAKQRARLEPQRGVLEITKDDLDRQMADAFFDLYEMGNSIKHKIRTFRFWANTTPPLVGDLFEEAAILLSSVETSGKNLTIRHPRLGFDKYWASVSRNVLSAIPSGKGKNDGAPLMEEPLNRLVAKWFDLVDYTVKRLNKHDKQLGFALQVLGSMYNSRAHKALSAKLAKGFDDAKDAAKKSAASHLTQKYYALSMNLNETAFCELKNPRKKTAKLNP